MRDPVGLVYWGRGGGGHRCLQVFAYSLLENRVPVAVSLGDHNRDVLSGQDPLGLGIGVPTIRVGVPRDRSRLFGPSRARTRAAEMTTNFFSDLGVSKLVVVMPHPWDPGLLRAGRARGLSTTVVIHDHRPHLGEIWPTRRTMKRRIDLSDQAIFLSKYVLRHGQWGPLTSYAVTPLPEVPHPERVLPRRGALFIGRFKRYKGLNLLRKSWAQVHEHFESLTIAGAGRPPTGRWVGNVRLVRRWLPHAELEALILGARVVVLPYVEATQSGIVPLSQALGTPIASTAVGGLPEQLQSSSAAFAAALTPESFADAMMRAAKMASQPRDFTHERQVLATALVDGSLDE